MHKSKLFELLTTLEPREWKELKKSILSNTEEQSEVYQLFLRIEKHKSDLNHKHLLLDYQHNRYYAKLTRKTVLNLLSKLAKQVERFLIITEIERDENLLELYKIKVLNRRGLYDKANQLGNKMRKKLSDHSHLNLWYPWYLISLNHTLFFSYNPIKNSPEGPQLLENCISSTRKFQEYLLLFYEGEVFNRENLHKEDWTEIKNQLNISNSQEVPEDKLSYLLFQLRELIRTNSSENYNKLHDAFFDDVLNIDQGIAIPIFIRMRMHIAKYIRSGNQPAIQQLSNLLYLGITSGKYLFNGKMDSNSYITTVSSLTVAKEWDKVNQILDLGKDVLPIEDYSQAHALAKMNILLKKNQTKELVEIYHKTKFNNIEFKTIAIPLLLRALYQDMNDDREFMDAQIRNYKDFIRRNHSIVSEKKIIGQTNFITILKLMVRKTELHLIRSKLDGMNSVFYRSWIEDQLDKEG